MYFQNPIEFNAFVVDPEVETTKKLLGDLASKDIVLGFSDKGMLNKNLSLGQFSVVCNDFGLGGASLFFTKLIHARVLLTRNYMGFERKEVNTDRQNLKYDDKAGTQEKWYKKFGHKFQN